MSALAHSFFGNARVLEWQAVGNVSLNVLAETPAGAP